MARREREDQRDVLSAFHPAVAEWFRSAFEAPTPPQELGWRSILEGQHTLILAPTGSGKTLAAFLVCIDVLLRGRIDDPPRGTGCSSLSEAGPRTGSTRGSRPRTVHTLYISPLKALNYDIERNLRAPLSGIETAAKELGIEAPPITVGVRTGDTPQRERQRMARKPPDILVTTPESLHLILTSAARRILHGVRYCIVDEIHSLCPNKRGVFLSLLLERLEEEAEQPFVRIGLSATLRPLGEVACFLGGRTRDEGRLVERPVHIVDAGLRKSLDVRVVCPVRDLRELGAGEIWPAIYRVLYRYLREHKSTLIFANSRRVVERIAASLNELAGEEVTFGHHGSVSQPVRRSIEEGLKQGRLPAVAATGTLELGIDMGAIDLVCQVESPHTVTRGLQRVGRAGHLFAETSKGRIIAKVRGDLLEAAVIAREMLAGNVEPIRTPRNCLDVLAQQIVAMVAVGEWDTDSLYNVVRRAYPYCDLPRDQFEAVVEMVSGRYPAREFRDLRPRVSLDRLSGRLAAMPGAQRAAIVDGGAIPDTGQYSVNLAGSGLRLGELDEEFVYESRVGDVFVLGTNTWRVQSITEDRVNVVPTSAAAARMPFWRGEMYGRELDLGRKMGALVRSLEPRLEDPETAEWLTENYPMDERGAWNLIEYVKTQCADSSAMPTDRRIVVEQFNDELGEPRIAILTCFGRRLHLTLRLALEASLRERLHRQVECLHNDDGILFRFSAAEGPLPTDMLQRLTPEALPGLVVQELRESALFGLRFRQNAARALLMPTSRPGRRTPLWLQRLKAKDLLRIAATFEDFPVVLETYRECLEDYLDVSAAQGIIEQVRSGDVEIVTCRRQTPSPLASTLMFDFTAIYLYEWDEPKGIQWSGGPPSLTADHRPLTTAVPGGIDERSLDEITTRLQGLGAGYRARTAPEFFELLRKLGDLTTAEATARIEGDAAAVLDALTSAGQIAQCRIPPAAEPERWVVTEDLPLYVAAFQDGDETAAGVILRRCATQRAVVTAPDMAERYGVSAERAQSVLQDMATGGELVELPARPGQDARRWGDPDRLEAAYRLGLHLRKREAKPIGPAELTRFLLAFQHRAPGQHLADEAGLSEVLTQLQGLPLPARLWESEVLARRLRGYDPKWLDEACHLGEWVWRGFPGGTGSPGRVAFFRREQYPHFPQVDPEPGECRLCAAIRDVLARRGASFLMDIALEVGEKSSVVLQHLMDLVWAGEVTQDGCSVLRPMPKAKPRLVGRRRRMRVPRGSLRGQLAMPRWALLPARDRQWSVASGQWSEPPAGASPGDDSGRKPSTGNRPLTTDNWDGEALELVAMQLLLRYGVMCRDLLGLEHLPLTWRELYDAYLRLEMQGKIVRGYYVEDLSGAQFALPSVHEELTSSSRDGDREPDAGLLIDMCDPANAYGPGALFPLTRPGTAAPLNVARTPSNYLVLRGGRPVACLELGARRLTPLVDVEPADLEQLLQPLRSLLDSPWPMRPFRRVRVESWGSGPVPKPVSAALEAVGFIRGHRGLTLAE